MRLVLVLAVLGLLGAGLVGGYVLYRQLEMRRVTLAAALQLAPTESGAHCGRVEFGLGPRTIGDWLLELKGEETVSVVVVAAGGEDRTINVRVVSPHNRTVFFTPQAARRPEFTFAARVRGAYRFEFDNRHSAFKDKQLSVSICLV